MEIIKQSVFIVDYEKNRIIERDIPDSFEEYVNELINHIKTNDSVRKYKTQSRTGEVINLVINICDNINLVNKNMSDIAKRLMIKESLVQKRIEATKRSVQKGSLIQVLLKNDCDNYIYLLAKVEHTNWVDDSDFSFKTGFSRDSKTIWKSCLIDIPDLSSDVYYASIYSNHQAKYWSEDFLELIPITTDEINTQNAFKAIERVLNNAFKSTSSPDHTIMRNSFISYFMSNSHIDFECMVKTIMDDYNPIDENVDRDKIIQIKDKMLNLLKKDSFDNQFNSIGSAIKARIKKVYPVNRGIELKITNNSDLINLINSVEIDGKRYLQIRTNNIDTFNKFKMS